MNTTNQQKWEEKLEQILLNRIKFIGEKEQTYLGYPVELIKELENLIRLTLQEQREEIIKEVEKMPIETVGNSAKTIDQVLKALKQKYEK